LILEAKSLRTREIYAGIDNLMSFIAKIVELATFYLFAYLMLPLSESAKKKRAEFQKFLFCGFVKPEELESAILAQNPGLSAEKQGFIREDLQQMGSFLGETITTRTIVAGMVEIEHYHDYAYMRAENWRFGRAKEHDVVPSLE
jgi:hypothetical protein